MPARGFARLDAVERRVRRCRRLAPWARNWLEGLGVALGFALVAAIGHALTAVRP
jgi:hypothetical protein